MVADFLDRDVVDAHERAAAGNGDALLGALDVERVERRTAAWLTLWWLAAEDGSEIAHRALAYGIALRSRDGRPDRVTEACQVWLMAEPRSSTDASTAITLLSGLEFAADQEAFPALCNSSVAPFLRSLTQHPDINVVAAVLDFLQHMHATGVLSQLVNKSAAESLHGQLESRIAKLAPEDDLSTDLTFLQAESLPESAPHRHRDLVRLAMDLMDAAEAAGFPTGEPAGLVTSVHRRALLDEALAQKS